MNTSKPKLEKEKEIKAIWLKYTKQKVPKVQIFKKYLGDYFDNSSWNMRVKTQSRDDWLLFLNQSTIWQRERDVEQMNKNMKEKTNKEIEDIQNQNRKRLILILQNTLMKYEENPLKMKDINIAELRRLYQTIQSMEEQKTRTNLQKGKLKLDAVKTILPYQRIPLDELEELKNKINGAFQQTIRVRNSGDAGDTGDGQAIVNSG